MSEDEKQNGITDTGPGQTDAGSEPVLRVEDLSIGFTTEEGETVAITDKVRFDLRAGEIYGLVGESGCGKTVTSLALLRLLPVPSGRVLSGSVRLKGEDILAMSPEELRSVRGRRMSMIFQEPSAAMNPLQTVEKQLLEGFEYHGFEGNRLKRILELLERVGIADPPRVLGAYPYELSGGMLQRVMIAMALLLKPDVIIADEPTTALDVTVQAQIMELLVELQKEEGAAILLITHNLGLIAQYADRLAVMYAGRIVEESTVDAFLDKPLHPYSNGLLNAIPDLTSDDPSLKPIPGQVPRPAEFPTGCRFRERCPRAFEPCGDRPELRFINSKQKTACFLY